MPYIIGGVENAVKKFNGMFAFAYFDFRYKELWLGRDRMGIKPLYYTIQNGNIIFASEIKAILEHPKVNCEPDVVALSTHISYEYLEGKWTCYKNVFSILPGSLCRVKQNTLEEIIYFDVIDNINVDMLQEPYGLSADGCVSEFQTLIKKSVGAHLIGDAPIATFCSGGVDSSLITAYAKEMNNNIISYVANVEDALPEAQKAKEVGKYLGVDIRVVNYSTEEYLYDWAKSIWFNDMPPVYRSDQAFMAIAK